MILCLCVRPYKRRQSNDAELQVFDLQATKIVAWVFLGSRLKQMWLSSFLR
jgi:hypothetical protein